MRVPTISAALILSVGVAGRANCQTGLAPPTTSSAIFGRAEARGLPEREGSLDLVVQVFGGYDNDVLADQGAGGTPNQERLSTAAGGFVSGVGALLSYSRPGLLYRRQGALGEFSGWVDSSIRYYPGLGNLTGSYHRLGLQLSAPLNRRLTLHASPRAEYSPRYSFRPVQDPTPLNPPADSADFGASEPPASEVDHSVVQNNSFRYGISAGASIAAGAHSTVDFLYGYTKRNSDLPSYDMEVKRAGVSFDHQFARDMSLKLGYARQEGDYGSGLATRAHDLDIGIDYSKPLSQTRKTFLRFNTGSTITDSVATGRSIRAIGSASLVHHMGRTWTAHAQYRRQLRYLDGFDRPLFADTVSTGLGGLLSQRMEFVTRASYSTGTVGLRANAPRFDSVTASARLRRGLTRKLAGYVEALYDHYAFEENAVRPPGLPPTFDRFGVRIGLTLWIPLIN